MLSNVPKAPSNHQDRLRELGISLLSATLHLHCSSMIDRWLGPRSEKHAKLLQAFQVLEAKTNHKIDQFNQLNAMASPYALAKIEQLFQGHFDELIAELYRLFNEFGLSAADCSTAANIWGVIYGVVHARSLHRQLAVIDIQSTFYQALAHIQDAVQDDDGIPCVRMPEVFIYYACLNETEHALIYQIANDLRYAGFRVWLDIQRNPVNQINPLVEYLLEHSDNLMVMDSEVFVAYDAAPYSPANSKERQRYQNTCDMVCQQVFGVDDSDAAANASGYSNFLQKMS